jgi:hypothetical protein
MGDMLMNIVFLVALPSQPPGFFDLTFPTDSAERTVTLLACAGGGLLLMFFSWRLGRVLRRLPAGRMRQKCFWQGSGGLLLGIGGFWTCQVLWLLWYYALGDWYNQHRETASVPYHDALLHATWWLLILGALLGASGAMLYTKAKAQVQQMMARLVE